MTALRTILAEEGLLASAFGDTMRKIDRDFPPTAYEKIAEIKQVVGRTGVRALIDEGLKATRVWISVDHAQIKLNNSRAFHMSELHGDWLSLSEDAKTVLLALFKQWPHSRSELSSDLAPINYITLFYRQAEDQENASVDVYVAGSY